MRTATALVLLLSFVAPSRGDDVPLAEKYLVEGKLTEGEAALNERLAQAPEDDQARFGLGVTQFLRGVERLSQNLYRDGVRPPSPILAGPIGVRPPETNPNPRVVRYADLRQQLQAWIDELARAEATLARIKAEDVNLPLHFGRIRLDLDGDGRAGDAETVWKIYARLNAPAGQQVTEEAATRFVIAFDRGDVAWLRGYCHLLMAMSETALAYDGKELFAHCGHLLFEKTDSPFAAILRPKKPVDGPYDPTLFLDAIAAIHLLNLPLIEPKRMGDALKHLEAMTALSRESWAFYLKETDDDHEWIPNPKQSTVMPNGKVTDEMVQGWMGFLDQADAILAGKMLIPFWRGEGDLGVNLRKVFTEPRDFDLVLWVQGTDAMPYVEKGPKATGDSWNRLQRIFRGEFIGFAFWFN